MKGVIKNTSKKALALLLAVVMMFSVFSVAFSALADEAELAGDLFAVTSAKPAIPMAVGSTISLNNVKVEFAADEFIAGADITWVNENSELVYDAENNTLTANVEGNFKIQAKKSETESKDIYVLVTAGDLSKIPIFNYEFSSRDSGAASADSYYTFGGENKDLFTFYAEGGSMTFMQPEGDFDKALPGLFANNNGNVALNTEAEEAEIIADFADYTLEYAAAPRYGKMSENPNFMMMGRYQMSGEKPDPTTDSYLGYYLKWSATESGVLTSSTKKNATAGIPVPDFDSDRMLTIDCRMKFSGDDLVFSAKPHDVAEYTEIYKMSEDHTNDGTPAKENAKATAGKKGTIAWNHYTNYGQRISYIRVFAEFTAEELEAIGEYVTSVHYIPASKPAIPMQAGSKLDLSNIFFEFDDGTVKAGRDITWINNNDALIYNEANNTIIAAAEGTYKLTAKKSETESKDIYVLVTAGDLSKIQIFNYEFSAEDAGTASAGSYYTFGGENKDLFTFYVAGGSMSFKQPDGAHDNALPGLYTDATGYVALNTEAEEAEIIADFADYTLEYAAAPHYNKRDDNITLMMMGRYQMSGETPYPEKDSYLGYYARWRATEPGALAYSDSEDKKKSHVGNASAISNYDIDGMLTIDCRIKLSGDDLVFSAKPHDVADYSVLYTMSQDPTAPEAAKATAGQKGTIVWYHYNQYLPRIPYIRVFAEFTTEEIEAIGEYVTSFTIIPASKPAIPMNVGQVLHLDNVNLVAENGVLILGDKATWTISDSQVYAEYDESYNSITAFGSGYCTLTATDAAGNSAVVYLTVANTKGEYVIYDHTFSADDLQDAGGYNVFTEDSEWALASLTQGVGVNQLRLGWNQPQSGNEAAYYYEGMSTSYTSGNDATKDYNSLIYLRPETPSGKKVSTFADFTLDYSAGFWGNDQTDIGPTLRLKVAVDNNNFATRENFVNHRFYHRSAGLATFSRISDLNGWIYGNNSYNKEITYVNNQGETKNVEVPMKTRHWFSYSIKGNDLSIKVATDANYSNGFTTDISSAGETTFTLADGSTTFATEAYNTLSATQGGTIGFHNKLIGPYGLYDVAVRLTFSQEELAFFSNFVEDYNDLKVTYYEDISEYRGQTYTAPEAHYGKVFAGWFTDEACTEVLGENVTTGSAYAKFVSTSVFGVKWQITNPAIDRDTENEGTQIDMRLVSSLDNTKYNRVGFYIERSDGAIAELLSDTVYEQITGEYGEVIYEPTIFSSISKYFATINLTNMKWETWGDQPFTVTTVIETKDGTKVYNTEGAETFKPCYDNQAINLEANNLKAEITGLADTVTGNTVYYVSNDGLDTNAGTSKDQPLKTVNAALEKANVGDAILLRRGDTFHEQLVISKAISIGAYDPNPDDDILPAKPNLYGSLDLKDSFSEVTTGVSFNQSGLNSTIEVPEGYKLWSVNTNQNFLGKPVDEYAIDIGAIFFISEDTNGKEIVTVADKKWNRADGVGENENRHALYNEEYDKLTEAYDFFYDYSGSVAYVLLPEGVLPSSFKAVEVPFAKSNIRTSAGVTLENLTLKYGNFGVTAASNVTCRGLEIGWIGGARHSNLGDYATTTPYDYTRLGNGIEIWDGGSNLTIDRCYVYECYDAGITFQGDTSDNKSVSFENITFSNNLLERNVYNIEYFAHHEEGDDASYMKDIIFEGNISRAAGGTQNDIAWGAAYRPDKGVATHIKGYSSEGNFTVIDGNGKSTFVIKDNIFDGSINSVLGVSAMNEGGEPIFENNMYVQAADEAFRVNSTKYSAKQFKEKYDPNGDFVARQPLTSRSVYASARTLNSWGKIETVDNLNNTLNKLQNGTIRVGYLGGSVTNGTGANSGNAYRNLVTEWLKNYGGDNNVTVIETNAAWGGTGSSWGYFRMNEQLLMDEQDLVFVEFAINDSYADLTDMESALYMEGIVKKIRSNNPYTDIVIVFITDQVRKGEDFSNLLAHKAVAEHYGIPTINVGKALADEITNNGKTWADYLAVDDIVHPNDAGHAIYASTITDYLASVLTGEASAYTQHEMPTVDYVSNQATSSEIVTVDRIANNSGFTKKAAGYTTFVDEAFYGAAGSSLSYYFHGKTLGLFLSNLENETNSVTFQVTIDGKETVTKTFKGGDCREMTLVDNLSNGSHSVKIEIIEGGEIAIGGLLISR